jgi:hypothetical protein
MVLNDKRELLVVLKKINIQQTIPAVLCLPNGYFDFLVVSDKESDSSS